MQGFIYLWYDRKHKRYYIGRHWGAVNDGYICSSRMMRQAYNRRPHDFKRRVLSYSNTKELLVLEEQRWLDMIKYEELGIRYYNKNKKSNTPSTYGFKHSAESKRKIGNALRGRIITHVKTQKWKDSVIGRTHSEEEKKKRANSHRGLKRSEEFKAKMRVPKQKVKCPHCDKIGGLASMIRWHFDNCNKYKNKELSEN